MTPRFVSNCKQRILKTMACFAFHIGCLTWNRRIANNFHAKKNKAGAVVFPYVVKRKSRSVQILAYHRVNDDNDPFLPAIPCSVFERQMEYLASNYNVLSLDLAVERMSRDDVPENAIVVTCDDGYRDNYLHAFPILKKYSVPATIFLATGAIGSGKTLWHDQVFAAFKTTKASSLAAFVPGNGVWALDSGENKLTVQRRVLEYLWSLNDQDREQAIYRLHERLEVPEAASGNTCRLMLSWEEVCEMNRNGIHFGAHTVNHPILSRLGSDDARREIISSKETIEGVLNEPVTSFAYPVGRSADFTPATKTIIEEAGFDCGLTMMLGNNEVGSDMYELRRIAPWDENCAVFGLRLSAFQFYY